MPKLLKVMIRDILVILGIWLAVILVGVGCDVLELFERETINRYISIFGCYFAGIWIGYSFHGNLKDDT